MVQEDYPDEESCFTLVSQLHDLQQLITYCNMNTTVNSCEYDLYHSSLKRRVSFRNYSTSIVYGYLLHSKSVK